MAIEAFAPAKINLTLHVTGQRADGYHLLDSLVGFARVGDRLRVSPSETLTLACDGPQGDALPDGEANLVLRAARLFPVNRGADIRLHKTLPVASGLGGGSSDAAAALRALSMLWDTPLPSHQQISTLGADLPVCLRGRPARMRGTGDRLDQLPPLPPLYMLLVNPGVALSTRAVFGALRHRKNPPMADTLPRFDAAAPFCNWLKSQRNDLQAPAIAAAPVIADVLAAIDDTGCLIARMSGSGATCFGLYPSSDAVNAAQARVCLHHPDWWVVGSEMLSDRRPPQLTRATT